MRWKGGGPSARVLNVCSYPLTRLRHLFNATPIDTRIRHKHTAYIPVNKDVHHSYINVVELKTLHAVAVGDEPAGTGWGGVGKGGRQWEDKM